MKLSRALDQIDVSGIRKMFELSARMPDSINLGLGMPDFLTPPHIIEAAKKALDEGYIFYTPNKGLPELREAISKKLKRENGMDVDPDREIIVTAGGTEAMGLAIRTIVDKGDEVLIPTPGFVAYIPHVVLSGGRPVEVECKMENEFKVSIEDLKRKTTEKTKLLVINSPCNPTGSVLDRKDLEEIADFAVENDIYILSDEVYEKFIYDGEHYSIGSFEGLKDRVITLNSFSKTYGMTGWRLAYVAASEEIINQMTKLQMYFSVCATSFVQKAGVAALEGGLDFLQKIVREYSERRDLAYKMLSEMDMVSVVKPRGALYIFPSVKETGLSSQNFCERILTDSHVVTVPGSSFGRYGEGYVRILFSVPREKLETGLSRIAESMKKLKSQA